MKTSDINRIINDLQENIKAGEDIIKLAGEAGLDDEVMVPWSFELGRFAALVAAAERQKVRMSMKKAFRRMAGLIRADEREQCAKVCDEEGLLWGQRYAAAIRARNNT